MAAMSIGGTALAAVRIGMALWALGDPATRTRLRTDAGRPSPGGMLALTRELAQGVALLGGSRSAHRVGGTVDALHSVSMLAYAVARPGRGAAAEGGRAAVLAVAEWVLA